jgi:riboflavin synthase
MFTGIIERVGIVKAMESKGSNITFTIESEIADDLKIDQSLAHNGVCLTVISQDSKQYKVTAIDETLKKSNIGHLKIGDKVNLERCMAANGRFDGHIVQGHVDQTATCKALKEEDGSWLYSFKYEPEMGNITVEKGSICINGVSLTCFNSAEGSFTVAIIPYTYENTNFHNIKPGDTVNLEFDIIGKYISKILRSGKD